MAEPRASHKLSRVVGSDPLANYRAFIDKLSQDEKERYIRIRRQTEADLQVHLTQTELDQIAVIRFWLDSYDGWAHGKDPDKIPHQVQEVARKYRAMLLEFMSTERRGTQQSGTLDVVKKLVLEMERAGGGTIKIEATKAPKTVDARVVEDG